MADVLRNSGVSVRLPERVALADAGREGVGSRGFDFTHPIVLDESPDTAWGELRVALERSALHLVDTLDLVPDLPSETMRAAAPEVVLDVPVADDEDAVVLADEDGVLTWVLPEPGRRAGDVASDLRGAGAPPVRRFRLVVEPERVEPDGKRSLDWVTGWTGRRIKALVLRWAAETVAGMAADVAVHLFERRSIEGLVWVNGMDPTQWAKLEAVPGTGGELMPRRVLLLVHGTFSSTLGSFGALGHGSGAKALRDWLQAYDLILGYDHHTLSKTPEQNARAILDALRPATWLESTRIDVVCYSRGGLVARTLIERLLPTSGLEVDIGTVVCVATTNAGTLLARPQNWKHLLDLTTNLAMAASRVMALVAPPTAVVAAVLGETISGVAVLVKALATVALEKGHVPGLQAMDPDGDVVQAINSGPTPALGTHTRYVAVASDFAAASLTPEQRAAAGLPPRLLGWIADALVDRLFEGAPNDLVVHNASTMTIHPGLADRLAIAVALERSPEVYHLNFFLAERTAADICSLAAPAEVTSDVRGWEAPEMEPAVLGAEPDVALAGAEELVDLFGEASAPSVVEVGKRLVVEVVLQREPFLDQPSPSSARAEAEARPDEPLLVSILPRRGMAVVGDSAKSVPMPTPEAPQELFFLLEGVEAIAAPAEVFVSVRQGADRLMKLELGIRVVAAGQGAAAERVVACAAPPVDRGTPAAAQLEARLRRSAQGYELDFWLDAPALCLREAYPPLQLPLALRDDLEGIYAEIEKAWAQAKGRPESFEARLRGLGTLLAEQLLPPALRACLWEHRSALQSLELETDEPFIPWEMLYVQNPQRTEGLFLGELGFTRAMRGAFCPDAIRVQPAGTYCVVPRYPSQLHLDFALDEEAWLTAALGAHPVDVRPPDRAIDLRARLAEGAAVDLLHYAGHGDADEDEVYLVMGGDSDGGVFRAQLFASVEANPIRLQNESGGRALVFLNACKAGRRVSALSGERSWARTFLVQGKAGAFIAPLWSVGDRRAGMFARELYDALRRGDTFAEATRAARTAARQTGDPTWLSYSVFASPHCRVVFG